MSYWTVFTNCYYSYYFTLCSKMYNLLTSYWQISHFLSKSFIHYETIISVNNTSINLPFGTFKSHYYSVFYAASSFFFFFFLSSSSSSSSSFFFYSLSFFLFLLLLILFLTRNLFGCYALLDLRRQSFILNLDVAMFPMIPYHTQSFV